MKYGIPYYNSVCEALGIHTYYIFAQWYNLAMEHSYVDVQTVFASTLVLGGVFKTVDHEDLHVSIDETINLFAHWMARNLVGRKSIQSLE